MKWFSRLFTKKDPESTRIPRSMTQLKGTDPCWCGSGRVYRQCHRKEDRSRLRELRADPRQSALQDAFM